VFKVNLLKNVNLKKPNYKLGNHGRMTWIATQTKNMKSFFVFFLTEKTFFSFLFNYKMFLNILDKNEFIWVPKYFNHKERLEKFSDTRVFFFFLSSSSFMSRWWDIISYFFILMSKLWGNLEFLNIIKFKISSFNVCFSKWLWSYLCSCLILSVLYLKQNKK
jgi:hypothetical protein